MNATSLDIDEQIYSLYCTAQIDAEQMRELYDLRSDEFDTYKKRQETFMHFIRHWSDEQLAEIPKSPGIGDVFREVAEKELLRRENTRLEHAQSEKAL